VDLSYSKGTDSKHTVKLESHLISAEWLCPFAIGGQTAKFEVRTSFVGDGAPVKVTGKSEKGKKAGKTSGTIMRNKYVGELAIPEDIEYGDSVYFEASLPKNSLSGESFPIPAFPPVEVTNMKWSAAEARRGDILTLTADVRDLPDDLEIMVVIYEYDEDGIHDRITELPVRIKDRKIKLQWEYEYHEDTDEINTETDLEQYGKHYSPPEYFFAVKVGDAEYGREQESGLLLFKDWMEVTLKDHAGKPLGKEKYTLRMPDGTTRDGNLDDSGYAKVEDVPPGTCTVDFPDLKEE